MLLESKLEIENLYNSIGFISFWYIRCVALRELILSYLAEMTTCIGNITKRTNFNVNCNRLHEPVDVDHLVFLNLLSSRENKLHFIPNELGDCSELHVLDVSGNR